VPYSRAVEKIQHFGPEAQLTLAEAAAVLDVSESTFERLAIPCAMWGSRTRRWRYATLCARARELELMTVRALGG
jgi:hypothetical protein